MESVARRLKELFVPIHEVAYMADDPTEELQALGYEGYWPGYFAARSAPLGRVPAEVVDALFYNFAPGEVAAYIPSVWEIATPEAVLAARQRGCVAALRRILGDLADSPAIARAAELATRAAFNAPMEGRLLYAGLRSLPVPEEPLARLWHAATLLREHRGDGHLTALVAAGIDGQEAHVLQALYWDMKPRDFGRLDPLTDDQLDAVVDGLRLRGLVDAAGWFTPAGRKLRTEIEELTDTLAAPAYTCLEPQEIDELITDLGPVAAKLKAASPF
ncbi:MAG TPA: MarR family transcriptional regulator [Kribbella sp.]|uniref:SCO6745 family protein n=1 Tax=Kribbella sp. TaxID=1871183 RepID=UPI002D79B424|nr:MarR family transcriptional regulator [Kribbella sp.]HET6295670.1 MarR family transcriptional regulator [Kribbella sp.]